MSFSSNNSAVITTPKAKFSIETNFCKRTPMQTLAIWTFTFHQKLGCVYYVVNLKGNGAVHKLCNHDNSKKTFFDVHIFFLSSHFNSFGLVTANLF